MKDKLLTAAKLLVCNTLQTSNSFTRSDTAVVIDNGPHLIHVCKTSLPVGIGCSAFPFYTLKNVNAIT